MFQRDHGQTHPLVDLLSNLKLSKLGLSKDEIKVNSIHDGVLRENVVVLRQFRIVLVPFLTPVVSERVEIVAGFCKLLLIPLVGIEGEDFIGANKLWGKELSFNNFLDAEAAVELVWEFDRPAAVLIKHTNPCGAALGHSLAEAYEKAYAGDPLSAFGSIAGFNRPMDVATAEKMAVPNTFFEVIIAPEFEEGVLELVTGKRWWGKTVRILQYDPKELDRNSKIILKQLQGGLLLQEKDTEIFIEDKLTCVTDRKPTEVEMEALKFAWTTVKHVKSNAILLAQGMMVVGV